MVSKSRTSPYMPSSRKETTTMAIRFTGRIRILCFAHWRHALFLFMLRWGHRALCYPYSSAPNTSVYRITIIFYAATISTKSGVCHKVMQSPLRIIAHTEHQYFQVSEAVDWEKSPMSIASLGRVVADWRFWPSPYGLVLHSAPGCLSSGLKCYKTCNSLQRIVGSVPARSMH